MTVPLMLNLPRSYHCLVVVLASRIDLPRGSRRGPCPDSIDKPPPEKARRFNFKPTRKHTSRPELLPGKYGEDSSEICIFFQLIEEQHEEALAEPGKGRGIG